MPWEYRGPINSTKLLISRSVNYLSVNIFSTKVLIGDTIFILPFADVTMSDIEEAAPANSLTDLSDNEIEIETEIE